MGEAVQYEETLSDSSVGVPDQFMSIKVRRALPDFLQSVRLKYVLGGVYHAVTMHVAALLIIPLVMLTNVEINRLGHKKRTEVLSGQLQYNLFNVLVYTGGFVFGVTLYRISRP